MKYFLIALTFIPNIIFAQEVTNIETLVFKIIGILARIIPLIIAFALIAFLWGVIKYAIASDPKDIKTGMQFMINGIIALFVMTSLWGFVYLLYELFGFDSGKNINWFPGIEESTKNNDFGNSSFDLNTPYYYDNSVDITNDEPFKFDDNSYYGGNNIFYDN